MEHFSLSEELTTKSATELARQIRARVVSPVEVVEAHLRRIERINPSLNAIVTLAPDALDRARDAESALTTGEETGPLHGLPVTVKDTIETKGLRTTSGSRLLANNIPDRDATVVTRLKAAGAIVLGKTNTPEMAAYYESDNPVFGHTNNPHDLGRTPGGSSGGEAAAIVSCLSPAGIGSDLAGSVRLPAHFCGIAGLKPTMGRVSMGGHVPPAIGSLSLGAGIGPMARSVADLSLLFGVMADATQFRDHEASMDREGAALKGLRVAWYTDDGVAPVTRETHDTVVAAANALRETGFEVDEARPPGVSDGFRLWIELFARAVTVQLREFYRGREDQAGRQVSAMLGKFDSRTELDDRVNQAEKLAAAVLERERLREELLRWMKTTPLILAPVGSTPAFAHGTRRVPVNGESISVWRAFSYSQTFNVFGLPSVAVPAGRSAEGLPIAVQIIGRPFEERPVLAVAEIIEQALGGWQRPF